MDRLKILIISLTTAFLLSGGAYALACNVCHSKNPKMVQMHKELGFKDCFVCHGRGMKRNAEEQKAQMAGDRRCVGCHKR